MLEKTMKIIGTKNERKQLKEGLESKKYILEKKMVELNAEN